MSLTHDLVAAVAELVGTALFLFLAEGGAKTAIHASASSSGGATSITPETLMYVSLSFGLSLTVVAWAFFRISGSLFNPAISLALFLAGALPWKRTIFVVTAQFAGGIIAAALVKALTPYHEIGCVTLLAEHVTVVQGFFLEAILTAALVFTVLMLAAEKSKATFLAPIGIGLMLFVCHLVGAFWTGAGLNPARALGTSVVAHDFPTYHWIYFIGPILGSILAVAFYLVLKAVDYSKTVSGQDADHAEGPGAVPIPAALYGRARSASVHFRGRKVIRLANGQAAVAIPADELNSADVSPQNEKNVDLEAQEVIVPLSNEEMLRGASHHTVISLARLSRVGSRTSDATAFVDANAESRPQTSANAGAPRKSGTFILIAAPEDQLRPSATAEAQEQGAMLAPGTTGDGLAGVGLLKTALSQ